MDEKNKTVLLIEIIVSLILALAFFSNYAIGTCTKNCPVPYDFMLIFLFGIIAIIFLYLGHSLNQNFLRFLGFFFSGCFILVFGWVILDIMIYDENYWNIINPIKSTTLWGAIILSSAIVFIYFAVELIRKYIKIFK